MNSEIVCLTDLQEHPVLRLSGAVDIFVVKELYDAAQTLLARGEDTTVQWATVETVDVSTLQVLLALQTGLQAQGRHLYFEEVAPTVQHTLATSGLTAAFNTTNKE